MAIFAKATRMKLRFDTPKGQLSVEDLWDLPLINNRGLNLDNIARDLYKQIKESEVISFVEDPAKADTIAQLKLDIVKEIITYKKAREDRAKKAAATKAQNARIMQIVSQKQDEALQSKSVEELMELMSASEAVDDENEE